MRTASKTISAERLVRDALEKAEHFNDYNIFTYINRDAAITKAREIDAKIKKGEKVGKLAGVPYALKDNFLTPEGETTAAAHILEGFTSPITATAIKKLEDEGAIMIGRVNMDAFAHGTSTENSYYGPTLNSHDMERVSGGSSGGSAVAVALDIVEFATGTDTGGSIRQPAAFNGIYGFKPTYGTISRYGVVAMASSTDCIGFFTKSPEDMDLLMSIASGQDPKDLTTLPDYYGCASEDDSVLSEDTLKVIRPDLQFSGVSEGMTVGVVKDFDNDTIDAEIREALKRKVELLKKKGHKVVELLMPSLKYALSAYYVIVPAEIASNLSRYDGVRYGFRSEKSQDLNALYKNTRDEGFMSENKRRIMIGNFVLSSGFYDAYFLQAAKVRTLIINEYQKAFEKCDFVLMPISPNPPFKIGEKVDDPVAMYMEDMMSVSTNLAGVPALAIPAGKTKSGLPVGLQLIGPRRSDRNLIVFSKELEEND